MKVLLCHNYYQQRGGEDQVFEDEAAMLESRGHHVARFTRHNDDVRRLSPLAAARASIFNRDVYRELRALIRQTRPQVMHCTNTFALISPAAYYAARGEGVPVVQSLHNFRLVCPNALLLREGRVCEECLGKRLAWPGVVHACYRGSRAASAAVAAMLLRHRLTHTWRRAVDRYIALSQFARDKFVAGGLPERKIVVKPNFVSGDPGMGEHREPCALFVGRLSEEKGVRVLLDAWAMLAGNGQPALAGNGRLTVIGDGPLGALVAEAAGRCASITWLGRQPHGEVLAAVKRCRCVVVPSICYENFPKAVVEAYATGAPVIAPRLGSLPELVHHERTGLLYAPGDAADLAANVRRLFDDDRLHAALGRAARQEFLAKYTAEENYRMLIDIYERAVDEHLPAKRCCPA